MTFDPIIPDSLWSVRYDNCPENAFFQVFNHWTDPMWLRDFFFQNQKDLNAYFKVTNVDSAIYETIADAHALQCLILDVAVEADLNKVFRPLEPSRISDILFGREKAKGDASRHPSWLRIYALKAGDSTYIVTGGAIKLTATMQEREHTLEELRKMEMVRNYLISEGVVDKDGFIDYLQAD
ncbi:MAG: hypothetical protein J6S99_00060 [Bacteroidales bacterium]|jgi:hypothetical protein|nr:hypothetical protein [Bacteroidales bacterium]